MVGKRDSRKHIGDRGRGGSHVSTLRATLLHLAAMLDSQSTRDREFVQFVRGVATALQGLEGVSPSEIVGALEGVLPRTRGGGPAHGSPREPLPTGPDYSEMAFPAIEEILARPDSSKAIILKIATQRFGMPSGVLTRL